jgi:hypothetical protein
MKIGLFLPHVGVFGGVRRYLELGNEWVALGHDVTLHHVDGTPPAWLPFAGRTATLASAAAGESDLAVCGDGGTYAAFRAHRARRHVYYCVLEGDPGLALVLADPAVTLMANSARCGATPDAGADGGAGRRGRHPHGRSIPSLRRRNPLRVL